MRPLLAAWCAAGIAYVAFMFLVDVPMYWSRWLADEASGRHYLSLTQGLLDVSGPLGRVAPLAGLAERDRLDVALFQRGGLAQHRAGPRAGARQRRSATASRD